MPDKLDNLKIRAAGDIGSVEVSVAWHLSTCYTQSSDEVWTKGKAQQVIDFFKKRRRLRDRARKFAVTGGGVFAGIMLGNSVSYILDDKFIIAAITGLLSVALLTISILYSKGGLVPPHRYPIAGGAAALDGWRNLGRLNTCRHTGRSPDCSLAISTVLASNVPR